MHTIVEYRVFILRLYRVAAAAAAAYNNKSIGQRCYEVQVIGVRVGWQSVDRVDTTCRAPHPRIPHMCPLASSPPQHKHNAQIEYTYTQRRVVDYIRMWHLTLGKIIFSLSLERSFATIRACIEQSPTDRSSSSRTRIIKWDGGCNIWLCNWMGYITYFAHLGRERFEKRAYIYIGKA